MLNIVAAGLATECGPPSPSTVAALLEPACQLLASSSAALTTATNVSVPASSDEAEALSLEAERLAVRYGLIATVDIRRNRFYARFVRQREADA